MGTRHPFPPYSPLYAPSPPQLVIHYHVLFRSFNGTVGKGFTPFLSEIRRLPSFPKVIIHFLILTPFPELPARSLTLRVLRANFFFSWKSVILFRNPHLGSFFSQMTFLDRLINPHLNWL